MREHYPDRPRPLPSPTAPPERARPATEVLKIDVDDGKGKTQVLYDGSRASGDREESREEEEDEEEDHPQ